MYEKGDLVSDLLEDNSDRRKRQKELDIRVIIGNPPYSAGQSSENDNNKNIKYPFLDKRIEETYVAKSNAGLQKNLYDSYIRGIRWASDRIGNQGVIGFVTNAGFLDSNSGDGLRKCLADEFSNLYIFHLRGNARTSGELRRKEKDNVFGQGTRTPIAISILVKNPQAKQTGNIQFYDIGDYLTREQKLEKIAGLKDINGIQAIEAWQQIIPDEFGDWLNQRDTNFDKYISMGDKKDKNSLSVFDNSSLGVATNRDSWVYNFSQEKLADKMKECVGFYNSELNRYHASNSDLDIADFINSDKSKISWTRALKNNLKNKNKAVFNIKDIRNSLYRPFSKTNVYFNKMFNEVQYQLPKIYPTNISENKLICLTLAGSKGFSTIITNLIPDLHLIGDSQCFPLYLYEEKEAESPTGDLFAEPNLTKQYERKDAISDKALSHFAYYYNQIINKADLFYYIYGLLHSEDYRERYADNLSKQLPRIPRVKSFDDFMAFSKAGRELADLHLNYETVDMYMGVNFDTKLTSLSLATPQQWAKSNLQDSDFYVEKMKFAKKDDKSKIVYNGKITLINIPLEAYDYVVNGKSAIEWVMERQSVKTDKDSGITNNANDWAIETMGNARYPLELLLRVINVSLKTNAIVAGLPKLVIE